MTTTPKLTREEVERYLEEHDDERLAHHQGLVLALLEDRDRLREALLAVSPWKLEDCWCPDDNSGGNVLHCPACALARAAIAESRRA